jgi:hypothetical protein
MNPKSSCENIKEKTISQTVKTCGSYLQKVSFGQGAGLPDPFRQALFSGRPQLDAP